MDRSYDQDILLWSEHQGLLLRTIAIAAGGAGSEAPDWDNIIEEIEAVGRMQLVAVQSLLVRALTQDLRATGWPASPWVPEWRAEARGLRREAARAVTPSMRDRIDLQDLYDDALAALPTEMDGSPPLPVPTACPATLDEMLGL